MATKDCEFYNFCYNTNSQSDIKYEYSPCRICVNEVGDAESAMCDSCYGCDECNFKANK